MPLGQIVSDFFIMTTMMTLFFYLKEFLSGKKLFGNQRVSIKNHFNNRVNYKSGLTLLELLVVVFILSAIAFSAISVTNNADEQFRYNDTQARLINIRRAITGESEPVFGGQNLLTGYIVDNGLLPMDIQSLLVIPINFDNFQSKSPVFDPTPDANGFSNGSGDEIPLSNSEEQLFKGYRNSYLAFSPGSNKFNDGWGNQGLSGDPNFGWQVNPPDGINFNALSFGADGAAGGSSFNQDIGISIGGTNWQIDVAGWDVKVINGTGVDISLSSPQCHRVSLLIYRNDADQVNNFNWKRLTSECVDGDGNPLNGFCLDGTGDGLVNGQPCASSIQTNFPVGPPSTLIPIGQHLLIMVDDNVAHQPWVGSSGRITTKVNFYAGTVHPTIDIRMQ